ncbi:hypothetical protein N657DRAFT_165541 [Parathielavia appendiculata]|uniref:Uncharacterized protein n=1 Tax=Parathielavia appendiculata TaxID=2587402 RepID=A0AAN6TUK9_9PEZI|nr:hypothetical protein N657DRAFT_165541 [Parathielavia appendiculata]
MSMRKLENTVRRSSVLRRHVPSSLRNVGVVDIISIRPSIHSHTPAKPSPMQRQGALNKSHSIGEKRRRLGGRGVSCKLAYNELKNQQQGAKVAEDKAKKKEKKGTKKTERAEKPKRSKTCDGQRNPRYPRPVYNPSCEVVAKRVNLNPNRA